MEEHSKSNPGTAETKQTSHGQQKQAPFSIMAIIGFIFAIIIPPIGLILSIIAAVQISKNKNRGMGLAVAGIIISVLLLLFSFPLLSLAYFGVLSPDKMVTDRCMLTGNFICNDISASGTTAEIQIMAVRDVENVQYSLEGCTVIGQPESSPVNGQYNYVQFNCPNFNTGGRFEGTINVDYQIAGSSQTRTDTGEYRLTVN